MSTERTSLLEAPNRPSDQNVSQDAPSSDAPLAEEKSTLRLLVIMGSVWIGVFFNALGTKKSVFIGAAIRCPGIR